MCVCACVVHLQLPTLIKVSRVSTTERESAPDHQMAVLSGAPYSEPPIVDPIADIIPLFVIAGCTSPWHTPTSIHHVPHETWPVIWGIAHFHTHPQIILMVK